MKNKTRILKRPPIPKEVSLPDPPLQMVDTPEVLPTISQAEVLAYVNAKYHYQLAQADYEMKRAALILKLRQGCHADSGTFFVSLEDGADRLVLVDSSSDIPLIVDGTRRGVSDWLWALEKARCAQPGRIAHI